MTFKTSNAKKNRSHSERLIKSAPAGARLVIAVFNFIKKTCKMSRIAH